MVLPVGGGGDALEPEALLFDPTLGAYVIAGSGVVLSALALQRIAAESRERTAAQVAREAGRFAAGVLTAAALGEVVRRLYIGEAIRQYTLGRGGLAAMLAEDWQALGALARVQFRYLDAALLALERGTISAAMLAGRTPMYLGATHRALEAGRAVAAQLAGMDLERRVLSPADHCADCIDLAGQGWQTLGTLPEPGDGSTACRSNCRCYKVYKRGAARDIG